MGKRYLLMMMMMVRLAVRETWYTAGEDWSPGVQWSETAGRQESRTANTITRTAKTIPAGTPPGDGNTNWHWHSGTGNAGETLTLVSPDKGKRGYENFGGTNHEQQKLHGVN